MIRFALSVPAVLLCLCIAACGGNKDPDPDVWYPPSKVRYTDGFDAIKAEADNGDPEAMYILGTYNTVAEEGKLTRVQMQRFLLKAADRRHRNAQTQLFHNYRKGYGYFATDYNKAIYWAQRISCDNSIESVADTYLADLYGGTGFALLTEAERSLAKPNLPLAYAHLRLSGVTGNAFLSGMKEKMSAEQINDGDRITAVFRSGGCPYDN